MRHREGGELVPSASKAWWQQATALVSLGAGGAITGLSFVPQSPAELTSPASLPINLMALEHAARQGTASDATLRSAIINVAKYYLRMAESKTPAEMQAIIWQQDSLDGADQGASCAAFASMTLALGAGYEPQPGDLVVFDGHVEVVTQYPGGNLHTIGADSLPDFSVHAHDY